MNDEKRLIKYTIVGHLYFEMDENIDLDEYLDVIQRNGDAEVTDVEIVKNKENKI